MSDYYETIMGEHPGPLKNSWKIRVLTFYHTHFPTDKKTFIVRIPVVGFVLSLISLQYWIYMIEFVFNYLYLFVIAYIVTVACLSVELYWGLLIGDRKQFTPWILLKIFEIGVTIPLLICFCVKIAHSYHLEEYLLRENIGMACTGFIFTLINGGLTFYISEKSYRQYKGPTANKNQDVDNDIDNIYEFPLEDH